MRIAFDHQAFCLQRTGGISRYFVRIAQELNRLGESVGVFAPFYRNLYLRDLDRSCIHGHSVQNYPSRTASAAVAINGFLARRQIKRWQPDIVHETYFSKQRSSKKLIPSALTVFDMIEELGVGSMAPSERQLKSSAKYAAISRADHVVCISERTRQDLIDLYSIPSQKVTTIYLGCDRGLQVEQELSTGAAASRPYLLFVGLRDGYKNFERLLRAFASSKKLRNDFDVVAFGGGQFSATELVLIDKLKFLPSQIRQYSGSDQLLSQTYRGASAFVYPSLYEGFGLPPLEAMAHSCPVVSSDVSAMPEVLGDAAQYFDPLSIETMAKAIEDVVLSKSFTQSLVERGLKRVARYTWADCASQHLSLYSALKERGLGE
jgi:glycosyltransferase involved in cell wall biosynthesis